MDEKGTMNQKSDETENVNKSLQKIAKGTTIVIIGAIIATLLNFIVRFVLARSFTQAEYGIYSLGIVILNIVVMLSLLGFTEGTTRQIAYYRGKNDLLKVKNIVFSSIKIVFITSLIFSIILFFASDFISINVFHDQAIALPLKVLCLSILFFTIMRVFISIFRGFDQIKEKVYFENVLKNILFLLFLIPVIALNQNFIYVIYAFTASIVVTSIVFIFYFIKNMPLFSKKGDEDLPTHHIIKDLLLFSIPLLGISILQSIMSWIDTLMLGGFETSISVGLYNAAVPLAHLLLFPISAMLLIYAPIISGLFAKNLIKELRRNYIILTKWIASITLPLFLLIVIFPEMIIGSFFGVDYIPASQVLRILSMGLIFSWFLGPTGTTLIAIGKTRFLMAATIIAASVNVILNFILIPLYGIMGASIATSISLVLHCTIKYIKVCSLLKVTPLNKNLLIPPLISTSLIVFICFLILNSITVVYWMLPLFFILFYIIHVFVILVTRSLDKEDIHMILTVEAKIGINLGIIKRIINKFI